MVTNSHRTKIEVRPVYAILDEHLPPSKREHYVRLVAANGRTLATSEVYANRSNAKRAARDWLDAMADVIGVDLAACEIRPVIVYGADGQVLR